MVIWDLQLESPLNHERVTPAIMVSLKTERPQLPKQLLPVDCRTLVLFIQVYSADYWNVTIAVLHLEEHPSNQHVF